MSKSYAEVKDLKSKYWNNKPVMNLDEKNYVSKQIDNNLDAYKKNELTKLPVGYFWEKINLGDQEKMTNVVNFLTAHYDRGGLDPSYIIKYDPDRLRWEMNNVGYFLTVCKQNTVPKENDSPIVGLVGFTFRTVQINSDRMTMTEPMYMCCSKLYRKKGLAKVLMDETIRQSSLLGLDKGIFCDNRIVPKPVATIRQYSRPLNYKKLRENDFIEICGVDDEVVHNRTRINLRPNPKYIVAVKNEKNIDTVYQLYNKFVKSFNLHMVLSKNEVENFFFNDKYVKTVIVNDENNLPVDFIAYSFYDIYNLGKTENNVVKASNILMYSSNETRADLLFINVLKQISADKIQIVYINDIMHNNEVILSKIKNADEDTDDEEENAVYDMGIVKIGKKTFINLFNWKCGTFRQDMVSWLIF